MSKTSERNFIEVVINMLSIIPENDILKESLINVLNNSKYKAPELKYGWDEVQKCLINRFGKINIEEHPEWVKKCLNIWTNN